jgi:hypothetical integral membrane protein (TIGR02206 family)
MPLRVTPGFVPYGAAHVGAVLLTGLAGAGLARLVRGRPTAEVPVRGMLFAAVALLLIGHLGIGAREGWLTWEMLLPLHLCDAATVLALLSLARPHRGVVEILYFWAGSGSVLAMLTPDLPWGFPAWGFFAFFGLHGLVIVSALVLVFGLGFTPRPGGPWRAFLATASLAALAGTAGPLLGMNYMFLRWKPQAATPLDWMGPWPLYILTGAVVALIVFHLLALPFRREWRESREGA